jgi:predicted site-specific integrase-resolvase
LWSIEAMLSLVLLLVPVIAIGQHIHNWPDTTATCLKEVGLTPRTGHASVPSEGDDQYARKKGARVPSLPDMNRPGFSRYARRARRKLRGVIYARSSSRFQHSTADQVRECRAWAQARDVEVSDDRLFTDERQTGKKSRRGGFQAFMRTVRAREVDVIIIFSTNRLFRKLYKTLKFVEEEIVDRRIRVVFAKSNVDTDDTENWRKLLALLTRGSCGWASSLVR